MSELARRPIPNQDPPTEHAPDWLANTMQKVENNAVLDHGRTVLDLASKPLANRPALFSKLRGEQFGHAVHPMLTDFPLGAWTSATILDIVGGRRSRAGATALVGFGVASAVPTAVTGLAEWRTADPTSQRVGVAHATSNSAALACYTLSLAARLRGHHYRGVLFGMAGGVFAVVGGYLGGHLSLVRKIGTADPAL